MAPFSWSVQRCQRTRHSGDISPEPERQAPQPVARIVRPTKTPGLPQVSPTLFTSAKTLHQHSHNAQAWLRLQTGHLCWLGSVGAQFTALPSEVAAQNIFTKTATHTLRGLSKVSLAFVCLSELSQAPMHQSSVANHESPPLLTRPGLGVIFCLCVVYSAVSQPSKVTT